MDQTFWINNPIILADKYFIILPTTSMSRIEQMNTITRFLIYFLILCIIFNANDNLILYIIIAIVMIIIFYFVYKTDPINIKKDLVTENESDVEKFTNLNQCKNCNDNVINQYVNNIYDNAKNQILKGTATSDKDLVVESGYIDFDGNYKIGPDYSEINLKEYEKEQKKKSLDKISWEKNELYKNSNSRKPTKENPFTNIVFSDYLDASNLAPACNIDNDQVLKEMENLYNSTIYRNLSDVWERENSQRIFYTVPIQTIPNDQTEFANWLYKTGPTCHENTENCTYFQSQNMVSSRY